jgi:hypothetical protein
LAAVFFCEEETGLVLSRGKPLLQGLHLVAVYAGNRSVESGPEAALSLYLMSRQLERANAKLVLDKTSHAR